MSASQNAFETRRPNLTLNTPMTLADERWDSPIDFSTLLRESRRGSADRIPLSEPHTPIEQLPIPGQPFYKRSEFSSVSSFSITEDEEGANEIIYPWSDEQDALLKSVYQRVVDSPLATPFSSRYPPSGVLHQVAKKTLGAAKRKGVSFPHSIDAIRRRTLLLIRQTEESNDPTMIPQNSFQNSFVGCFGQFPAKTADSVCADEFDFSDNFSTSNNLASKYGIGRHELLQENVRQLHLLAPPFVEQQPTLQSPVSCADAFSDEPLSVSRRKRDSFRLKRGQL